MAGGVGSVITVAVGPAQRLFAAHADVLALSPVLAAACRDAFRRVSPPSPWSGTTTSPALSTGVDSRGGFALPEEDPQVFACVLEFLYKGDYQPRLVAHRNTWVLEGSSTDLRGERVGGGGGVVARGRGGTISCTCGCHSTTGTCLRYGAPPGMVGVTVPTADAAALGGPVLRDTAVYCTAVTLGLPALARLALRKQSLYSSIDVGLALRSMRYAYAHTPADDSRLRAHYLALIIRNRSTFKRSGTMQTEIIRGGAMFFDLFVAMANHIEDLALENSRAAV